MRISVIIPTFRDNANLAQCLQALSVQTLAPSLFEVLVVNNAPEEPLTVASGPATVRVLEERRPGSYAARNHAIRQARGDVLVFTDSDCVPDEHWLQAGLEEIGRSDCARLAGEVQIFTADPPSATECYERIFAFDQASNARSGVSVTANLFVRREIFERVGLFNENLFSGGDTEWNRRAQEAGFSISYCADAIVRHPARRSWSELKQKIMRTTGGKLGIDPGYSLSLARSLSPPLGAFRKIAAAEEASFRTRLFALLIAYRIKLFRYVYLQRLKSGKMPLERQ